MNDQPSPSSPDRVSRRALVAGAAWAVPTIAVAAASPAIAASSGCTPQSAAAITTAWRFNGSIANWTKARNPSDAPDVGYSASYAGQAPTALANVAAMTADPLAVASTTSLSNTACLGPGSYRFAFSLRAYTSNTRTLTLTASVVNLNAPGVVLASTTYSSQGQGNTFDDRPISLTVGQRSNIRFIYAWSFTGGTAGQTGDDIAVNAPTVTKTA